MENCLKFNQRGDLVLPPQKPVLDRTGWKRISPKRRELIFQHKQDMEDYEVAKALYEALPVPSSGADAIIEDYQSRGKLLRNHGGIVLFDVDCIDHETIERVKETHKFFEELRAKAEELRRKQGVQTTLDGVVRFAPPLRKVDISIIKSFGKKPNTYLEKAWLESLWYGMPLTDWQSFQIGKRAKEFEGGW